MDESKSWLMSVHQKCLPLYFLVALDDNFIDTLTPFTHTLPLNLVTCLISSPTLSFSHPYLSFPHDDKMKL